MNRYFYGKMSINLMIYYFYERKQDRCPCHQNQTTNRSYFFKNVSWDAIWKADHNSPYKGVPHQQRDLLCTLPRTSMTWQSNWLTENCNSLRHFWRSVLKQANKSRTTLSNGDQALPLKFTWYFVFAGVHGGQEVMDLIGEYGQPTYQKSLSV